MSTSYLLFSVILIGLSSTGWAHKYLADTIKKERPEEWGRLGKPKYSIFGGKAPEAFKNYILASSYRNDANPKIARATLYYRISGILLICGVIASFFRLFLVLHK